MSIKGAKRSLLTAGASMLAMGSACAGSAQTTDSVSAAPPASSLHDNSTGPTTNPATNDLGEIVVTAQRRAERLQDVPITVTAVTPAALKTFALSSTQDLSSVVPGLVFTQGLTNANPYMRGIGQQLDGINIEQPVAIYIDGVYLFQPASAIFSFNNIAQIEVLKGPQGTLFGRNALGGVINIKTEDPSHTPLVKVDASYGNYDTITGHFYANTPLTDNLTFNVAAYGVDRMHGYGYNVTLKKHIYQSEEWGGQSKLRWQSDTGTDVSLNLLYTHVANYIGGTTGVIPGSLAEDGKTRFIDTYTVADPVDTKSPTNTFMASLHVRQDLGWATFINTAAYHTLWAKLTYGVNAIPFGSGKALTIDPFHLKAHTFSDEAQLQGGTVDTFNWIVGLYYLHDVSKNTFSPALDGSEFFHITASLPTDSYAAYGQATVTVLPDTRLTGGFRYTLDKKSISGTANLFGTISTPESSGIPTHKSWGSPSWRLSLDHKFSPDMMGFVSYNRGFASGTFNSTDFTNTPASPETIDAFEAGLKNELFDRHLSLNVAAFYYSVKNLQLESLTPGVGRTGTVALFNAASSHMYGTDVDFTIRPARGLSLSGGFELLHAKYVDFPRGACPQPSPAGGNPTTEICDLSGHHMSRAPKFMATLGAQYTAGPVLFAINDEHNSGFTWEPGGLVRQKKYDSLSGSITYSLPNTKWQFQLYGSNLLNKAIWAYAAAASTSIYSPGVPRVFGLKVSTEF